MWHPWKRDGEQQANLEQDRAAREQAEDRLAETKEQWPEVHRVADQLRRHRQANHFSERLMNAIRGDEEHDE